MKAKVVFGLIGIVVVLLLLFFFWSEKKEIMQMNNETCPVSGRPVNEKYTHIHEGKEYKLCSEQCKEALSEDPNEYISD